MATLVLKYPPLPDPDDLRDNTRHLNEEAMLVQAMRGVACSVSMLMPAYHFLVAAESAHPQAQADRDYPRLVTTAFMKEAMLDVILVGLRRLFEKPGEKKSRVSLGVATIAKLLTQPELRHKIQHRSEAILGERRLEPEEFNARVDILVLQCAMHVEPIEGDRMFARTFRQAELLRRAANKRAAHLTLDDYQIALDDIHHLVSNAILIGRQIQSILGRDACDTNYADVDAGAYEASERMFGISHRAGPLLSDG